MKKSWIFILLFVFHGSYAEFPEQKFNPWLEKEMKAHHVPGVSIAVIKNYHIEWSHGFGTMDKNTRSPVTINTLFQAGSISKPVTAMAALKAVQDGKLQLDKNINDYLTSWSLPDDQWTKNKKVTLRNLLDHSGGISVHGFIGYAKGKPLPTLIQVLNGSPSSNSSPVRVIAIPGAKFSYSGGGYTIVQQILIDIYHQPFPSLMQTLVLQPLNMTRSTFQQPLSNNQLQNIAMPYKTDGSKVTGGPHTYVEQAAAGLWTTPVDLAKFIISVQQSLKGNNQTVLNQHFAKLMVTPSINKHMGLGFEIGIDKWGKQNQNGRYFMHMGENAGYRNIAIANIDNGNGLIIMTNMSPDVNLVLQGKIKEDWSFIYSVMKKIAILENW